MRSLLLVMTLLSLETMAAPGESQTRREAKQHFQKGRAAYDAKDADTAIREYQAAFQLLPLPDFVFNLAQAYRLKGDLDEAIRHYRMYLTLDPRGAAAEASQRSSDELTAQLVHQREVEAQRAAEERAQQEREEAARRAAARAAIPEPSVKAEPVVPPPAPSSRRSLRLAGIAVGAVGLASLVVGAGMVGGAAAAHEDFFHPKNGQYSPDADARQRTFETLDVTFFAIGGVALATGVILYVVGRR